MKRFRYEYGASPLHLVAVAIGFAIAGYGALRLIELLEPAAIVPWFFGAIVAHDLILLPLYSAVGLIAYAIARGGLAAPPRVAALNHVRVPAVLAALVFLVWFPLILALDEEAYAGATGQTTAGFLGRWLLITAALFAGSALLYVVRLSRARWRPYGSEDEGR